MNGDHMSEERVLLPSQLAVGIALLVLSVVATQQHRTVVS